jgi:hypothetical protein
MTEANDIDKNLVIEVAQGILEIEDQLMHQVNPREVHEKILKLLNEKIK